MKPAVRWPLAARDRPDDEEGLTAAGDRWGEGRLRGVVREVLAAGEKPHEGPAAVRRVVPDRPAEGGIGCLDGGQDRMLRSLAWDVDLDLAAHAREGSKMGRKDDADHAKVWTSTESTGGRSRTIGAQLSPASGEAYTWPPVVPK